MSIEQPRGPAHIQVEVLPPDLVVVPSETESRALPGRLYPLLVPLIDGTNTVDDIIDRLAGTANALDVRTGLTWLEADGLIEDARMPERSRVPSLDHLLEPVRPAPRAPVITVNVSALGTAPDRCGGRAPGERRGGCTDRTHPSACAFKFGLRGGSRSGVRPPSLIVSSNAVR